MNTQTQVEAIVTFNAATGKYSCTIDGKDFGSSVYKDYFEFHYRRGDRANLAKLNISNFVHIEADGSKVNVAATRRIPKGAAVIETTFYPAVAATKLCCPKCGGEHFKKNGKDKKTGVQMYRCSCGKSFK
jgi:predicted RNA-binding Zn-ribbon protein involved in translation (DUF1610 family)